MQDKELARAVIAAFGGVDATARALCHQHSSTVASWNNSKYGIPDWRWYEIRAAAAKHGVKLPKGARE